MDTDSPDVVPAGNINPYAAPADDVESPSPVEPQFADAEAIRREHIKHEASVRSIGLLLYLGAVVLILSGVIGIASLVGAGRIRTEFDGMLSFLLFGLGILYFFLGRGIRTLRSWARWTTVAVIAIPLLLNLVLIVIAGASLRSGEAHVGGMIGRFIIAALIPVYLLNLLLSAESATIFAPAYKEIVARTPQIKCKTSVVVVVLLIVVAVLLVLTLVLPIVAQLRNQ